MQRNVASEAEEEVLIIRHTPRSRPRSPLQNPWHGPLPRSVKATVERAALDQYNSQSYAKWASSFALLTDELICQIIKNAKVTRLLEWSCYKYVDCCSCKVEKNYLWIQKHDSGWTIELCFPHPSDPDSSVLAIENMPILCPDGGSAAWLAQACYPTAPANLAWLLFW